MHKYILSQVQDIILNTRTKKIKYEVSSIGPSSKSIYIYKYLMFQYFDHWATADAGVDPLRLYCCNLGRGVSKWATC